MSKTVQTPDGTMVEGLDRPRRLVLSFMALQNYERIFQEDPEVALARLIKLLDDAQRSSGNPNFRVSLDAFWGLFYCGLLREDPTLTQARLDAILTTALIGESKTTSVVQLASLLWEEAGRMGVIKVPKANAAAATGEDPPEPDPNRSAEAGASQVETASASGSQKRSSKRSATA